jgi:hypothetical protein
MHNSRSTYRQKGSGFFGFIGAIVLFGSLFVAVTAVVPTYLQHYIVTEVIEGIAEETPARTANIVEIRKLAAKRFDINQVDDFDLRNITLTRGYGETSIELAYTVQPEIFSGIGFVLNFEESVPLK